MQILITIQIKIKNRTRQIKSRILKIIIHLIPDKIQNQQIHMHLTYQEIQCHIISQIQITLQDTHKIEVLPQITLRLRTHMLLLQILTTILLKSSNLTIDLNLTQLILSPIYHNIQHPEILLLEIRQILMEALINHKIRIKDIDQKML